MTASRAAEDDGDVIRFASGKRSRLPKLDLFHSDRK